MPACFIRQRDPGARRAGRIERFMLTGGGKIRSPLRCRSVSASVLSLAVAVIHRGNADS